MASYNGENYIANAISSIQAQTYRDWELIIVDDGSIDSTRDIVTKYTINDIRIKYIYQSNRQQGAARNKGISESTGEMIAFIDQDDIWLDSKLDIQIKQLNEIQADVLYSDGYMIYDQDVNSTVPFNVITGRYVGLEFYDLLILQNRIPILSAIVRRDVLFQVGLFEEASEYQGCDDYDLWLKIAKHGYTFYGMQDKLFKYRIHNRQASNNQAKLFKAELAVVKRYCNNSMDGNVRLDQLKYKIARAVLDQYFLNIQNDKIVTAINNLIEAMLIKPAYLFNIRRISAVIYRAFTAFLRILKHNVIVNPYLRR